MGWRNWRNWTDWTNWTNWTDWTDWRYWTGGAQAGAEVQVIQLIQKIQGVQLVLGLVVEEGSQAGDFLLEGLDFLTLTGNDVLLGGALAQARGGHAFADAALSREFPVLALDVLLHGFIDLMAEANRQVCQFLGVHLGEEVLVIVIHVVLAAKFQHWGVAWVACLPERQAGVLEVVKIVFEEFAVAALGDIQQFDLTFHAGAAVLAALDDVLLAAAGGLHHLVDGAVAVLLEETFAK